VPARRVGAEEIFFFKKSFLQGSPYPSLPPVVSPPIRPHPLPHPLMLIYFYMNNRKIPLVVKTEDYLNFYRKQKGLSMSKKTINFAFCIHNHQPVGNFEKVLDDAYNNAYHPWLDCLRRNPHMKLGLHNSGPLWDYFLDCKPEYIKKLRDLAKSGQVEILSGGYYEPILINISDRDKIAQIKKMIISGLNIAQASSYVISLSL
jgi:alpha-amylase/alpha-mannosidase (GH57 family)